MRYNRLDGFTHVCCDREYTGLQYDLWFDSLGQRRSRRNRSIVVYAHVGKRLIPIYLCGGTAGIKRRYRKTLGMSAVVEYVSSYHAVIEDHWNGMLSDRELLNALDEMDKGEFYAGFEK